MYLKIVCLNELNRNYFYLLPLRLLLLPLNKNCFSNIVGFCVYVINTIIHGCLEIWNFSSRVQSQGAEESCLTVMLAQFIAQIDLVIQKNERD